MDDPDKMAQRIRELEEEVGDLSDEIEVLERNQRTKNDQYQQAKAGWAISGFCVGVLVVIIASML